MKKFLSIIALSIIAGFATPAFAATKSEISITSEGVVLMKNIKIVQLAGKSFFARAEWNDIFLRMLIRTDGNTKIAKRFKGTASYKDILEGHLVNVEGRLNTSSDSFDIIASSIQDLSLESDTGAFSGTITAVNRGTNSFTLSTKTDGAITVSFAGNPTVTKGALTLSPSLVNTGDKVLSVAGSYNFPTKTLTANGITLYQDPAQFLPQTFEGVYRSTDSTTLPASLKVTIGGKEYAVKLSAKTQILNYAKKSTTLSRFIAGDPLRIYGKKVESLDPIIEAEVVRNTDL